MTGRAKSGRGLMLPAAMLGVVLLTGCTRPGASETETALCREMRADLPTWSRRDTPESLSAGARFVATFNAICPEGSSK